MKPSVQLSLAAVAVALALAVGYQVGSGAGNRQDAAATDASPAGSADASPAGKREVLYYRNPMGLADTSPVPKKDSMGMDYIPVYADDNPDDSGVVRVSPARVQLLGVKTALAERRVLDAALRAVGRVELNERAVVEVAPRFEGWIERLHVNAVGDPVRRGQPLFTVYSPELQSAAEELRIAERLQRDSAASATRSDPGSDSGFDPGFDPIAAESAARLAEATRARLRNWEVSAPKAGVSGQGPARQTFHSPAAGIVLEKNAVQGARFMPGEAIYRIADLSTVWVMADIFEHDLARIRVGQTASVTVDAFPGRSFSAKVAYLYPTLNAATRSTPLRLELDNRDGLLRPGMFAHVELASGPATPRITVPTSAVIDDGHRQVVLLALDEGRFKPQPVKLGQRGRDDVEVLEGVSEGERVVVSANFLIDSESQLRAALSNLVAGDSAPPERYRSTGVFDAHDAASGTITLTHEAIPALQWPEMTMDFGLAAPEVAAGIAPGNAIRFEFEAGEPGEYIVTRIEPVAPGAGAPRSSSSAAPAPATSRSHEGH
ncbi:MAG: efflux RND transporter periplasmic adaptor subunit [Azoarcus sp.]|nr:efflux RND transporter periplasmic adaptor subunit [Azoarcus sp.]